MYNVEKAFSLFLRVLNLIRYLSKKRLRVLFIGCPAKMEATLSSLVDASRHVYIRPTGWRNITKKQEFFTFHLILVFCSSTFSYQERDSRVGIPSIFFTDGTSINNTSVDFPITLNVETKGVENMFLFLVKNMNMK